MENLKALNLKSTSTHKYERNINVKKLGPL